MKTLRDTTVRAFLSLLLLVASLPASADFTISCYYGVKVDANGDAESLLYSSPASCAQEPLLDVSNSGVDNCPTGYIAWEGIKGGVIASDSNEIFFVAQRICLTGQMMSNLERPM